MMDVGIAMIWSFPSMGNTQKWMVDFMENPIQVDDLAKNGWLIS